MKRPRSMVVPALVSLHAAGCFVQASMGAQRSPGGGWGASIGLASGFHFDLNDMVGVGAAMQMAAAGYANQDGAGTAAAGPIMAEGHVELISHTRHALAFAGALGIPYRSSADLELGRTDESAPVQGVRTVRWSAGLSHRYIVSRARSGLANIGSTSELYTVAGVESYSVYGAAFDDVMTFGPSATVGFLFSGETTGHIIECALTLLLDCGLDSRAP